MPKDTFFCPKKSLSCRGKIINLSHPVVMGIVNVSPDSFYEGSRAFDIDTVLKRTGRMLEEGATFIDLGAASSRPGSPLISSKEEQDRLIPILRAVVKAFPDALFSTDTYRADTAMAALNEGAAMINDISGGQIDPNMFATIASYQVPYVLMHMQGTPGNMQTNPVYTDLIREVSGFFAEHTSKLKEMGVHDIIIDPGFGFGKTLEHNYQLLSQLDYFQFIGYPILAGVSRKSMINRVLHTSPEQALNGTTVLNTIALLKGATILRVHDVKEAMEAIKIFNIYEDVKHLD
jgi:dihydropteroate synthase